MSLIAEKMYAMPRVHVDALFKTEARLAALQAPKPAPPAQQISGGVAIGAKAVNAGLADGIGSLQGVIGGQPVVKPAKPQIQAQADDGWNKAFAQVNNLYPNARPRV